MPAHGNVRIVFQFFPLTSIHPWAESAAEAAGCADLQSQQAFWVLHDNFFDNQESFSVGNVRPKARALLAAIGGFDLRAYDRCLELRMSDGLIGRDEQLGKSLGVTGTPTLFINGKRYLGMPSAAALRQAIESAAHKGTSELAGTG